MKIKQIISSLIFLAFLPTLVCAGYREQKLGIIPPGNQLDTANVVFAPDGSKAAFVVRLGDKVRVMFGDIISKPYGHVRHVAISHDGRYVAHNGTPDPKRNENEQYLVVNGIETGPFTSLCSPTFTPDSSMVIFEVEYGGKWRFAISKVKDIGINAETSVADMHMMKPVVSPDGELIISIQQHKEAKKSVRLVSTVEMREVSRKEYDKISQIVYSLDMLRSAYVAQRKGKQFVVTSSFVGGDEQEGAPFDVIYDLVISADGAHIAYGALRGGKLLRLLDGQERLPAFYSNGLPIFSRDGRRVAYRAMVDGKSFIFFEGRMISGYDDNLNPVLNGDGSVLAFVGETRGQWRVNVNGKESPAYDRVDTLQFAPGDKSLVFRAKKNGMYLMVIIDLQGKVVREGPPFAEIWAPYFDETGRLGYGALVDSEIWWKVLTLD